MPKDHSQEGRPGAEIAGEAVAGRDQALERVVRLARAVASCRTAYVALVEGDGLRFVGVVDGEPRTAPRKHTLVDMALRKREVAWVQDASKEKALAGDPFVQDRADARFYAAAPVLLANGQRLGAVVVLDRRVRPYDGEFADQLRDLAALVAAEYERPASAAPVAAAVESEQDAGHILHTLVEDAPVGLVMTDTQMRILRCSRVWRQDRELDGEVIGKSLYDLFPHAHDRWSAKYEECLAGQEFKSERVQIALASGEKPWVRVHIAPWRDAEGRIGGLMIMSHDVTDIIGALERAERSERRLLMAMDLAKLFVWEFDFTRDEFMTGDVDAEGNGARLEAAATKIWEGVHPEDLPAAMALWEAHEHEGVPYRMDYRVRGRDGAYIWAAVAADTVRDQAGGIERIIGMLRNIDQEKQAEAALEEALHRAEAANRAKSEFLANMSHEIRTPLNGVLGVAGALAGTHLSEDQKGMVGLIETSAQTLGSLLTDILDLARIESGRLVLKDEHFHLAEMVRTTTALFEPDAHAKGLTVTVDLDEDADRLVCGDATRVRQVISNLISNAVKFTQTGGVTVSTQTRVVGADRMGVSLTVRDTGIGFDADTAARLFNRFEQADGSLTRKVQGAGLGLAISRSLAEAMGGSLAAASTPGEGSSFTFTMELGLSDDIFDEPKADPVMAGAEAGARVLLAEDHPTNRKVVELILNSVGVELTCVENGAEAVTASADGEFDLILMDMQMPVMDGLTATRLIREREAAQGAPAIPILCLTANAMPEHIEASKAAGADSHLTKPISAAALIEAVREAAGREPQPPARRRSA
jgi:PAS domain S-box-containing protein